MASRRETFPAVGTDFGVNLAVAELVEASLFGAFLDRAESGDKVIVNGEVLLLLIMPQGLPDQLAQGAVLPLGQAFGAPELCRR
jgi:hypothetical protein